MDQVLSADSAINGGPQDTGSLAVLYARQLT